MRREYTILVDSREKRPLPFPANLACWTGTVACTVKLLTRTTTLETGDYVLEGFEKRGCVERKQDLDELRGNLFTETGRRRFAAEFVRLLAFSHPLLLVEGSPLDLQQPMRDGFPTFKVRDSLLALACEYNVPVLPLPAASPSARRALGEWVAAFLIGASECPTQKPKPTVL